MAKSLALGLNLFAAGLLFVGAVAAAGGLLIGSEPEDVAALGVLFVALVLWGSTATLNAASLLTDWPRMSQWMAHVLNVASLLFLALFTIELFATDTATRVEIAILAIPTAAVPFGYWQVIRHLSSADKASRSKPADSGGGV
jgi:hypothetical protein